MDSEPCAFCGHIDSRHRTVDAIREAEAAGDDYLYLLEAYGLEIDQFVAMEREVYPHRYRGGS